MNSLTAIFWKGLVALLPLTITLYALIWIVTTLEGLLGNLVPPVWYFPGSGLLLAVALILLFGVLMHFFLFERLVNYSSSLLNRIPVVKSIYSAMQDFFDYLGHRSTRELSRVVQVTLPDGIQLIGFLTNPDFDGSGVTSMPAQPGARRPRTLEPAPDSPRRFSLGTDDSRRVCVYLPMSYQIGGYMVMVPANRVTPLDISGEDAMKLILTAGVRSQRES